MGQQQKPSDTNGLPQSPPSAPSKFHKATSTKKCQNDDQKPSNCIKLFINVLIYATCILSLSISVYLSYRHQQLESNVKSLLYLDKRVMRLEYDLEELIRTTQSTINERRDPNDSVDDVDDSIVKKLPVHVYSEITRLKRDVSNLKTGRRQRQTAIQQSPNENCMCPAGESLRTLLKGWKSLQSLMTDGGDIESLLNIKVTWSNSPQEIIKTSFMICLINSWEWSAWVSVGNIKYLPW